MTENPTEAPLPPQGVIRTVRGDMADWTDHRDERPAPAGPALARVLDAVLPTSGHTLILGPHGADLVDRIVASSDRTTILLRGHVDARAAARRYHDRPVEVVCGDLASLGRTDASAVIALDGVGRLTSVNVEERTWRDNLDLLEAAAPGAALVLGIENPLALGRISGAVPATADDDSAWRPYDGADATTPGSADEAAAVLPGTEVWAARPTLARPTLLTRAGIDAGVAVEVAAQPRALGRADLRYAVAALAARGRTDAVAAGWILVRGGRVEGDAVLVRDGAAVTAAAGDLPPGTLLETALLDACVRRDQPRVHTLVEAWAAAIDADPAAWASGTADNVVLSPTGDLAVLDSGLLPEGAAGSDISGHHLADLANRISDLGFRHPWPVAAGSVTITTYLLAAVGRTGAAAEAEALVAAARRSESLRPSAVTVPAELARERAENDALRSKVQWLESAMSRRQTGSANLQRVRELEEEIAALRGSISFRAGRALTAPARRLRAARKS